MVPDKKDAVEQRQAAYIVITTMAISSIKYNVFCFILD